MTNSQKEFYKALDLYEEDYAKEQAMQEHFYYEDIEPTDDAIKEYIIDYAYKHFPEEMKEFNQ